MSIRRLIAQALEEAREEFAEIVQRKLEALMGDAEIEPERPVRPQPRPARREPPRAAAGEPRRRTRTPESQMAELRSRIVAAMPVGEALKRAQILERAGLSSDDVTRVSNVLRKLKDDGVVVMRGERAAATYTRKS